MNIGLLDIDSHNFPNLALMKIFAYHKKKGDKVEFATMFNHYDIIYKSKVFTFTTDPEYIYRADKIIKGGTGYNRFNNLSEEIEKTCPDYDLYNCEHAYGFLTRGCINKCQWCIVPKKEGSIKIVADIEEIISDKKSVILMDNNILASGDYVIKQFEKIIKLKLYIDFNQGLDCRLVDNNMAKLLSKINWIRYIRFACDSFSQIEYIEKATKLLRNNNFNKEIFVYAMVKDINDALIRVNFLRKLKIKPFAQIYRDYENKILPTREQKVFCRWVNLRQLDNINWADYKDGYKIKYDKSQKLLFN
jgi:hypothetical protein